jgi:hypothetical protein
MRKFDGKNFEIKNETKNLPIWIEPTRSIREGSGNAR